MVKAFALCAAIGLVSLGTAWAPPRPVAEFRGRVIDAITGEPVAGAQVEVFEGSVRWGLAVTDSTGSYSTEWGDKLVYSAAGYHTLTLSWSAVREPRDVDCIPRLKDVPLMRSWRPLP